MTLGRTEHRSPHLWVGLPPLVSVRDILTPTGAEACVPALPLTREHARAQLLTQPRHWQRSAGMVNGWRAVEEPTLRDSGRGSMWAPQLEVGSRREVELALGRRLPLARPSTNHRESPSSSSVPYATASALRCSMFDVGCSMLGVRCSSAAPSPPPPPRRPAPAGRRPTAGPRPAS